jgi:hypothetical protein
MGEWQEIRIAGHALTVTSGNVYQFLPIFPFCGSGTTPRNSTHNLCIRPFLTAMRCIRRGRRSGRSFHSAVCRRAVVKFGVFLDHLSDREF